MKRDLVSSIKQAQDVVESSGVKNEYAQIAFEISLNYIIGSKGETAPVQRESVDKPDFSTQQPEDGLSYNEFIDQKKPKNDYEITACIVSFLTNGDVRKSITKEDLVGFIHQNPGNIKGLKNLNDVIRHTRNHPNYSYIETVKEGGEIRYRLSAVGKQLLDQLPQRKTITRRKKTRTSHD